jgi:hypothetical protein
MLTYGSYFLTYGISTIQYFGIDALVYNIYNFVIPDTYFEFITSDGVIESRQYKKCYPISKSYEYVVYTNKGSKSIISKSDANCIFDGNHVKHIQKPIKSKPFLPSLLLQDCITHYPYYYWKDASNIETIIDLQTDCYNFFIAGNVLNTCILKYIIQKHYPYITLTPNYSVKVLTSTYIYTTYESDFSIILKEE